MGQHISEAEWLEYLGGSLPRAEASRILRHVETCPDCAQAHSELADWHNRLSNEGARLRRALTLPEAEMDRFVDQAVGEICGGVPCAIRRASGRSTAEGMFLLRSLIEPILGPGTARVAIDLAVRRCTLNPEVELRGGDWPLFVNNLSETLGSISGAAAARLISRAGAALLAEAA
jgi:anti-sigma factor RsiW